MTIPATPADDTTPAAKTPPPSTPAVDPRRWLALAVLAAAQLMIEVQRDLFVRPTLACGDQRADAGAHQTQRRRVRPELAVA